MPSDFATLLGTLRRSRVGFVVVGPVAARARGAGLRSDPQPSAIDIVPDDRIANLKLLSQVLGTTLRARSRLSFAGAALPVVLDAETFTHLPLLPLATDHGDVTVLLPSVGGRLSYAELVAESSELRVRGVAVDVATVSALLDGLAGGGAPAETDLLADLRRLDALARNSADDHRQAFPHGTGDDDSTDLELAVQGVLLRSQQPATVREILAGLRHVQVRASYRDVRQVAEGITSRGLLERGRRGTANTYHVKDDQEMQAARAIARLLAATTDPAATTRRALQLLVPKRSERARRKAPTTGAQ
jgi:hypothetical protein